MRDWADIRMFLAILDRGSLSSAAEYLEITQPTVGRRLAAMEERFGTPLFVRSGRRMQLTDAGNSIVESARRMEREMLTIERGLESQSQQLQGEVIISAAEGMGAQWLSPVLFAFHQQYPDIVVKVLIENRAVDLVHREADLALRLGRPSQSELIGRRLCTLGFGLYASVAYLERKQPPSSLADLAEHNIVALKSINAPMLPPTPYPELPEVQGNDVYITNSPAAQLSAVKAGFGIGVISHRYAASEDTLQRVMPQYTPLEVDLWMVSHEELRYSARIRAVSDFIANRVIEDTALFERGE